MFRKFLLLLSGIVMTSMNMKADFNNPDFAFPATVITEARSVLKNTKSTDQGLDRLQALLQIVRATRDISGEAVYRLPALIDSVAVKEPHNDVRGLMQLLEANVYNDIYKARRWVYYRNTKLAVRPDKIDEWSSDDFQEEIVRLLDLASANLSAWYTMPIGDYAQVIEADAATAEIFPYLRDFLWQQKVSLLDNNNDIARRAALLSFLGSAEWAWWSLGATLNSDSNYEQLNALLNQATTNSSKALIYMAMLKAAHGDKDRVDVYLRAKEFVKGNQAGTLSEALDKSLKGYLYGNIRVTFPGMVYPGDDVEFTIDHSFTSQVGVKVCSEENDWQKVIFADSVRTDSMTWGNKTVIKAHFDNPGVYQVYGLMNQGKSIRNLYSQRLFVSPVVVTLISYGENTAWLVTDTRTGKPVSGVMLTTNAGSGFTDSAGIVRGKISKEGNSTVTAEMPDGTVIEVPKNVYLGISSYDEDDTYEKAQVLFSRPLYRPGDQLDCAVVLNKQSKQGNQVISDAQILINLYDDNYKKVGTCEAITDQFGRVAANFDIPEDVIAGFLNIEVKLRDSDGHLKTMGTGSVMVSEFKRPVFEIVDAHATCTDTAFVISGKAERYTGSAVRGAKVTVTVREGWRDDDVIGEFTGITNAAGQFDVSLENLKLNDSWHYYAGISVVTPSGDFSESFCQFRGNLKPELFFVDSQFDASKKFILKASAKDGADKKYFPEVYWQLEKANKTVAEGKSRLTEDGLGVDWTDIEAGKYLLKLSAYGCISFESEVLIYNTSRNLVPDDETMFLPETSFTASPGSSVNVKVGVPKNTQLYLICADNSENIVIEHFDAKVGFNTIKLNTTDATGNKRYKLLAICGVKMASKTLEIEILKSNDRTWLKGESWRNNILPGMPEHWSLKFSAGEGAMIATLYNKALEQYTRGHNLSLRGLFDGYDRVSCPRVVSLWSSVAYLYRQAEGQRYRFNPVTPKFRYIEDGVMMERAVLYACASKATGAMNDLDELGYEESATEEDRLDEVVSVEKEEGAETKITYRNADIFQIFWKPDITVDENGDAMIDFDMPDAIGSWQFRATAWNVAGEYANLSAVLQSSKPVTVEGNAPRFVRAGDVVEIPATVVNNTVDAVEALIVLETFDVATGQLIDSYSDVATLEPNGQKVVSLTAKISAELPMIGFRARVTGNEFTDGEQSMIPVLEAAVQTFDSHIFYMDGNENTLTLPVPADMSAEGQSVLQFCANPMWDVVKALPSLYNYEPKTSTDAVNSLFGALVAKGIAKNHPEVVEVVRQWAANPFDSALVSPLLKNDDLKMIALGSTPFVGAANYMSSQMQRLTVTLDAEEADKVASKAIEVLSRLQLSDGGFSWFEWQPESSVFITEYVLQLLGRLNSLGFLEDNARSIVDNAFRYLERNTNRIGDRNFAFLASLFPEQSFGAEGTAAVKRGVKEIRDNWRKDAAVFKAIDAMVLMAQGNSAEASEIVRSITEFAVNSPTIGLEIPSVTNVDSYARILQAVAAINPKSPLIDGLRKWLVLKTQTTDDLGAWNPTELIAAMLACGSSWTTLPDAKVEVAVDGVPAEPSIVEKATGTFTLRLPSSARPRNIEIKRQDGISVPSYGSLLTVANVSLDSVQPSDCGELSIVKRLLVENGDNWIDTYSFAPGQRIKVQLMIRAQREFEYVTVRDARPAGFEPVAQMPGRAQSSSLWGYRTNDVATTNFFFGYVPRGVHYIEYEVIAGHPGKMVSGVATIQSQYAPEFTARSGARRITVGQTR